MKKIYKMHLEGSGTPVLYIGLTVLKGYLPPKPDAALLDWKSNRLDLLTPLASQHQ